MKGELEQWDDARLVLSVTRWGSLKKAARHLGVHVSTVSRRVELLERTLGLRLFDRTSDGVVPTAAVERLLPFAEAMEQSALQMSHALEGFEAEPEGTVRISAPPSLVEHFLVNFAQALLKSWPKIRLELNASIQYADLTRREADIAIRTTRPTTGDLLSVALIPAAPMVLFAAEATTLSANQFAETPFITYSTELEFLPECQWVLRQVAPDRVVFRSNSLPTQVEAARRGLGAVVLAKPYEMLEGLARVQLRPDLSRKLSPLPPAPLFLIVHRALRQVPRIAATWDELRAYFGNYEG